MSQCNGPPVLHFSIDLRNSRMSQCNGPPSLHFSIDLPNSRNVTVQWTPCHISTHAVKTCVSVMPTKSVFVPLWNSIQEFVHIMASFWIGEEMVSAVSLELISVALNFYRMGQKMSATFKKLPFQKVFIFIGVAQKLDRMGKK